ncbi:hypothetical protein N219_00770 [Limosilactobacillus fermentum MTCC 8711]|nr:hypothetical protein N219_00770 [Limosilactobacillus fermentum MTCC 8711]
MGSVMTSALRTLADNQQTEGNAILNTLQQFAGAVGTSLSAVVVAQSQTHLAGSQAYHDHDRRGDPKRLYHVDGLCHGHLV